MLSLVTAAVLLTLLAVGLGYLQHGDRANRVSSASREPSAVASPSVASSVASGPSSTPTAALSPVLPGYHRKSAVTLTARPTPKRKPKPKPKPKPAPPRVLDFTLTTFNVLGASHTAGRDGRRGMASGSTRARRAAAIVRRHGSDVVGFQELQGVQLAGLARHTDLDFYPGFQLRRSDSENSIGWRRDRFELVERHVVGIPYFNGHRRAMPYIKLRSRTTGLEAWFMNFHNPADTNRYHHQQRWRNAASGIEERLANQLVRTGLPVFLTGDMNERASYFCRLTGGAPMIAARGGSHSGGCQAGRPRAVDWIFGSQGVDFTGYYEDRSHLVDITTDHPVVSARVQIQGDAPTG